MSALILALNPSIDAEWRVEDVLWEEKNNVRSERRWPGGKGINVARWLKHLGGKSQLLLPLGGIAGKELAAGLRTEKLPAIIIPVREPTRVNIIVTTAAGRQMRFNPPGPKLSRHEWGAVLRSVARGLRRIVSGKSTRTLKRAEARAPERGVHAASVSEVEKPLLILSGSLPRGVPVTAYDQLIRLAHRFGVKTLLDCDGPAFAAAAKARPFLVKPNEHELAQWWRKPLRLEKEIVCAARALSKRTGGWVLVSRGAKRSFLVNCTEDFQCSATPPPVKPRKSVGAGDALLAAVARQIELGITPQRWLSSTLATGTAATQCPPGDLPAPGLLRPLA